MAEAGGVSWVPEGKLDVTAGGGGTGEDGSVSGLPGREARSSVTLSLAVAGSKRYTDLTSNFKENKF